MPNARDLIPQCQFGDMLRVYIYCDDTSSPSPPRHLYENPSHRFLRHSDPPQEGRQKPVSGRCGRKRSDGSVRPLSGLHLGWRRRRRDGCGCRGELEPGCAAERGIWGYCAVGWDGRRSAFADLQRCVVRRGGWKSGRQSGHHLRTDQRRESRFGCEHECVSPEQYQHRCWSGRVLPGQQPERFQPDARRSPWADPYVDEQLLQRGRHRIGRGLRSRRRRLPRPGARRVGQLDLQ